ncbi:RNA-binding protein [Prosthecobacter sp.]|uniref:RNA recognition motif domain-containing protein n=1 Tax=Prosthecobacter sp. TaxID=1965333 RepID=UPI00248775A2|nr:RNA-binding protein [Prosthecobacter sp.]MDI1311233.1 RNA-binding protein [Prosthecobacter sp.]
MSDYPNRNGGDSNNGNRRNRNRNRPRGPRPEGPRPTREGGRESRNAPPSFFQKILGFFGIGKSRPKSRPQADRSGPSSGPRSTNDNPRPQREPRPRREAPPSVSPGDITTDRLYVGNLSYDASESDLFELFNGVGAVKNAEVVVNSRTQRSKGFAFVTMGSVEEARRAVQELSAKDFMGRPLQLSGAKPNTRGDDSDSPSQEEDTHAA